MTDSPEPTLTLRQAYLAMCEYLRQYTLHSGQDVRIGQLLSEMLLLNDVQPSIDARWPEWERTVAEVLAFEASPGGYHTRWFPAVSWAEKRSGQKESPA